MMSTSFIESTFVPLEKAAFNHHQQQQESLEPLQPSQNYSSLDACLAELCRTQQQSDALHENQELDSINSDIFDEMDSAAALSESILRPNEKTISSFSTGKLIADNNIFSNVNDTRVSVDSSTLLNNILDDIIGDIDNLDSSRFSFEDDHIPEQHNVPLQDVPCTNNVTFADHLRDQRDCEFQACQISWNESMNSSPFVNYMGIGCLPITQTTAFDSNSHLLSNKRTASACTEDFSSTVFGVPTTNKRQKTTTSDNAPEDMNICNEGMMNAQDCRFRDYQSFQWHEKFEELCRFQKTFGHCLVPHAYPANPSLGRWIKRQRYQFKLMMEGNPSTMTLERAEALQKLGFTWDSQTSQWMERLEELKQFHARYGHCNVPSRDAENQKLAVWVKIQRRQYKLFQMGQSSNITLDRIAQLERLNFTWEMRKQGSKGSV